MAALIDHPLLKPEATLSDIVRLCSEAREWQFACVCVNPCWVTIAAAELEGSPVRVCTVIGFPLGANTSQIKLTEAEIAISQGALEIDMVQNIGALRSGDLDKVRNEISEITALAHSRTAILKVILETSLLTDQDKVAACRVAVEAGADFVKTSTGFSSGGATVEAVALMRQVVGPSVGVKASGGVRTLGALRSVVAAGATRIGTSSGVSILRELRSDEAARGTADSASMEAGY
ncbi:MAG: deoxyribose-phosphate aldolase [Acidobacteriaceae bacterium]|nr:deoxyribose-phosphate aldolase [Acidobacteriaceae bacterium]